MKLSQFARRLAATSSFVAASMFVVLALPGRPLHAQQAPDESIVFFQSHHSDTGFEDARALYRVSPNGGRVTQLTPLSLNNYYLGAHWSLSGKTIVYEHVNLTHFSRSQIYRIGRHGGAFQRLTSGPTRHELPVWGPGPWVAFIGRDVEGHPCLTLIRPTGGEEHVLLCEMRPDAELQTPQWSTDGTHIYLESRYPGQNSLDPPEYSDLFEVTTASGQARLMATREVFGALEVSPDGTHGVYAEGPNMRVVDFATGNERVVTGTNPRFSRDGSKIAFTRFIQVTATKDFGAIYVMQTDGSHQHRITDNVVADNTFSPVDWSSDGNHILLDRTRLYVKDGHYYRHLSLHMVNARTHKVWFVADGSADKGAWWQP
jgi:Tol biopolymer transport system component